MPDVPAKAHMRHRRKPRLLTHPTHRHAEMVGDSVCID
jgi:hypothetical protein